MTAKEFFEKIGFLLEEVTDDYIVYACKRNEEACYVGFQLKEKYYMCFYNSEDNPYSQPLEITYKLHRAINKQIEELGWDK